MIFRIFYDLQKEYALAIQLSIDISMNYTCILKLRDIQTYYTFEEIDLLRHFSAMVFDIYP